MQNYSSSQILIFGCGKMGAAIVKSLIRSNISPEKISVIDPSFNQEIWGVSIFKKQSELPEGYKADLVFICIKPQGSQDSLTELAAQPFFSKKTIFISILSGKKIKFFQDIFGKKSKVIRAMPNLPIVQNEGVFAYLFNKNFKEEEELELSDFFANFGETILLKNEKKFDEFTAIFGSGPAYIFYLQEIFLEISKSLEIDDKKSQKMIEKLFLGSSLMSQNSTQSFSQLRSDVTSKNGTTEAAIGVLQKNDSLKKIFAKAIKSAAKRSKELSK